MHSSHGPSCLEGPARLTFLRWSEQDKRNDATAVRWDLVERVRREIACGTYETSDKMQIALTNLLRHIQEA